MVKERTGGAPIREGYRVDLRDLLSVLRARWLLIATTTVLGSLIALGLSLLATPLYTATVQFYVSSLGEGSAASAYQGSLASQQRVQSYAELFEGEEIARRVVEEVGADISPMTLAAQTEAMGMSDTVLLNVSVTDPLPDRAQRLATGFGAVLPKVVEELETPDSGGPAQAKLTVVERPALPTTPVSPRTGQNVLMGIALGLLIGVGFSLLANTLDRRVKTKEQVEAITSSAVVGNIPFRTKDDRREGSGHEVEFRQGHSPTAESFRRLRTNLQFLSVDKPPKIFVVTSSVGEEGKSETAVNLCLVLAEAGNRVLLVEADMRRPRVVNYMAMPDSVGLTNILTGQASHGDVIQETRHEGVHLLACGPLPPNPSELLSSATAAKLFDDLSKLYDYVVIDSPPLLPVTDGALLARVTDGAFLVVRSDWTTTDQVRQAVDNLNKADALLLGSIIVANKPQKRGVGAYAESYYYSSAKQPRVAGAQ